MAKNPAAASVKPQASMMTEVWYGDSETAPTEQIFYVQEIPSLVTAREPITYGGLESDEESQAKGRRKAESITMPVLYYEEQSEKLAALAESEAVKWFFVKLPDATAASGGKPLVYKFQATIDLSNDTISIDSMLQETVTLYKQGPVTRIKGLPGGGA